MTDETGTKKRRDKMNTSDSLMQLMCNNPLLYVADYPQLDGVEIIDKRTGVGTFMRHEAAQRFRREFHDLVAQEPDAAAVAEFIGRYSALMTQPAVYH